MIVWFVVLFGTKGRDGLRTVDVLLFAGTAIAVTLGGDTFPTTLPRFFLLEMFVMPSNTVTRFVYRRHIPVVYREPVEVIARVVPQVDTVLRLLVGGIGGIARKHPNVHAIIRRLFLFLAPTVLTSPRLTAVVFDRRRLVV